MQNAAITCEPGKGEYICTKCGEKQEKSIPEEHIMVNRVCIACGYHDELPELSVGMSKSQVESKWGEPIQVDKYTSERGTTETWWYKDGNSIIAVNFEVDGKVHSINCM